MSTTVPPATSVSAQGNADSGTPLRLYPLPFIWAVLGVVGAAVVIAAWLFALQAATQPKGEGLFVPPQGLSAVVSPGDGLVTEISATEGDYVEQGQQVGTLRLVSGETVPILSDFSGVFVGGWENVGAPVDIGQAIAQVVTVDAEESTQLASGGNRVPLTEVTVFVPVSQAKAIEEGTPGELEFAEFPAAQFGSVPVETVEVYQLPLAGNELDRFYGGSGGLVSAIDTSKEAVQPILVKLTTDPSTQTGYAWTFGDGPNRQIPLASSLAVTFATGSERLLSPPGGGN